MPYLAPSPRCDNLPEGMRLFGGVISLYDEHLAYTQSNAKNAYLWHMKEEEGMGRDFELGDFWWFGLVSEFLIIFYYTDLIRNGI